jgi:hypothetical protein
LKDLYFNAVTLGTAELRSISDCAHLENLDLTYCTFDADDFAQLASLQDHLKFLGLMFTPVGDKQLPVVAGFTNLRRLELGREVTDAGLDHLAELSNLEELFFVESAVTDAAIEKVTLLPKLKTLHLSKCRISNKKFAEIAKVRPTLAISFARDPDWPVTR